MVEIKRTKLGPTLYHPQTRQVATTINVSWIILERGCFVSITTEEGHCVEICCREDGTFQVCIDDATLDAGVFRFEDIYGPDPFKEGG